MLLLFDTGMRISELMSLRLDDVNLSTGKLTVRGAVAKTRQTRILPMSKRCVEAITALIRENEDFGSRCDHLIYSGYGRRMRPQGFYERLQHYAKKVDMPGVRISAHTFRHAFALQWIRAGGDVFSLQKMLGHTDMAMVRRYVRLSDGDIEAKHIQFSPINTLVSDTEPI